MTPAEIPTALVRQGTRIAVEGERVRLVFNGSAPPDDLIRAARELKAALREIVESGGPSRMGRRAGTARSCATTGRCS
jgi:hypothetical protein